MISARTGSVHSIDFHGSDGTASIANIQRNPRCPGMQLAAVTP